MKISLRNGFFGGLLVTVVLGLWLHQLWQPERQVQLHSAHLMAALENQAWSQVEAFLAATNQDQWGHDRSLVLSRLRQVLSDTRNAHLTVGVPITQVDGNEANWSARVTLSADPNELTSLIQERVNLLDQPFALRWQRASWKPWDWQLRGVSNPAIDLPTGMFP